MVHSHGNYNNILDNAQHKYTRNYKFCSPNKTQWHYNLTLKEDNLYMTDNITIDITALEYLLHKTLQYNYQHI